MMSFKPNETLFMRDICSILFFKNTLNTLTDFSTDYENEVQHVNLVVFNQKCYETVLSSLYQTTTQENAFYGKKTWILTRPSTSAAQVRQLQSNSKLWMSPLKLFTSQGRKSAPASNVVNVMHEDRQTAKHMVKPVQTATNSIILPRYASQSHTATNKKQHRLERASNK